MKKYRIRYSYFIDGKKVTKTKIDLFKNAKEAAKSVEGPSITVEMVWVDKGNGWENPLSCCKPIGAPCPWDILPPWKDVTIEMCEASGCLYLREKSATEEQSYKVEEEET